MSKDQTRMSFDYSGDTEPTTDGIYAVRTPNYDLPGYDKDIFVQLLNGRWTHIGSDQRFRGDIFGWAGPIPRTKAADRA